MQDLFREMTNQMSVIDPTEEFFSPREALQKGDIILGPLSIKLKQLFIFYRKVKAEEAKRRKEDNERIVTILHGKDLKPNSPDWEFLAAHTVAKDEVDFIWISFVHGVKREFPRAVLATNIAVRRGWLAVIPAFDDLPAIHVTQFRNILDSH